MNDLDRIKERISQCLRVSKNDASSQSEIDQAVRVAAALMRKHNIERDDVEEREDGTIDASRVSYGKHQVNGNGKNRTCWEAILSTAIQDIVGTVMCYTTDPSFETLNGQRVINERTGESKRKSTWVFYGPDEDARFAAEVFEMMRVEIAALGILKFGGWARGDGASYCQGYAQGFLDANRKETRKLVNSDDAQTRALIQTDRNKSLVIREKATDWLAETHKIKLSRSGGRMGGANRGNGAYGAGRRDGASASMPGRRSAAGYLS